MSTIDQLKEAYERAEAVARSAYTRHRLNPADSVLEQEWEVAVGKAETAWSAWDNVR